MDSMQRGFRPRDSRLSRLLAFIADSFNRFLVRLKPENSDFASQRVCPFCGLITPRRKSSCMECGHAFAKVPAR